MKIFVYIIIRIYDYMYVLYVIKPIIVINLIDIDGAFFGPTFPNLFFMTYEDDVPEPVAEQVCFDIYIYVYIYIYMYIYTHFLCIYMHEYIYTCIYVYVYIHDL
jgi:hypothetical protein